MDSSQSQTPSQTLSSPYSYDMNSSFQGDIAPPTPLITMNSDDMCTKPDGISTPSSATWTTPTSQPMKPRPATIHEGFSFCAGDEYGSMPTWETSSAMSMHTPSEMSRPVSMHQDFLPHTNMDTNSWASKPCEDSFDMHNFDTDMSIGQAFTSDEAIPILDLRFADPQMDADSMNFESGLDPRRLSGSSFTMSTSGGLSDIPSYEDFSAALSEAPSFTSDYPPLSNRNSLMSTTQLSPVASPRMTQQGRSELVRTQSRGRGTSPSPRPSVRSTPYNIDSSARNKRWSTGSYGTTTSRRPSPFVYHHTHDAMGHRVNSRHSSPTTPSQPLPLNFGNLQAVQQSPYLVTHPQAFQGGMFMPSQMPSHLPHQGFHPAEIPTYETPAPLLSHGLFRMLQSNGDPHAMHGHCADMADPPDLYASLHEEQIPPPPEDMNPEDPDLIPHEQDLRFEGDLYTPKWVRGHGNKREGWCGICKPGRWLVLKNSAFWYDKSFTHGISAATGSPFQEPLETRRMDGNPDVWEGLCGSCNDWIALVSSKKKGTTWFRHAYKCHTHPKVKDAPKRRREGSNSRVLAASQMAKPKVEPQQPSTPTKKSSAPKSATVTPTSVPVPPIPAEHQQAKQQQQQQRQIVPPTGTPEELANMI